jgi:hypothetical protein
VWQIWNEESSPTFWYRKVNARAYAELVRIAHSAAVEADPKAQILLGGLFPRPRKEGAVPIGQYLDQLYSVGRVRRWFDAVAVHPYARNYRDVRDIVARVRAIMARNGDSRAGLWITELGWASAGAPSPYTKTVSGQRYQLSHAYRTLGEMRSQFRLRGIVWFCWQDRAPQTGDSNGRGVNSGEIRRDGSSKPAWTAYANVAGGVSTAASALPDPVGISP